MRTLRYYISRNIAKLLPDKLYLSIKYRTHFGYWMDWQNPKTFCEKLQWLKIYDKHPEYTQMVDKVAAKDYVAGIIGDEYIIPTLGVYNSADEIDFEKLPNQFVLKCTHDSGGVIVCKDKSKLNTTAVKKKLANGLKRTYVIQTREYPYKDVPRRIIAEQYMEDESGHELKDYKFFCFHGEPRIIQLDFDRFTQHKKNLYTLEWELLPFSFNYPSHPECVFPKPDGLEKMIALARILSKGIPFVRVDLYNINGKIYFGELTFFPASGVGRFTPHEWDYKLGELIHLPEK
jgi:hypothetical protein